MMDYQPLLFLKDDKHIFANPINFLFCGLCRYRISIISQPPDQTKDAISLVHFVAGESAKRKQQYIHSLHCVDYLL